MVFCTQGGPRHTLVSVVDPGAPVSSVISSLLCIEAIFWSLLDWFQWASYSQEREGICSWCLLFCPHSSKILSQHQVDHYALTSVYSFMSPNTQSKSSGLSSQLHHSRKYNSREFSHSPSVSKNYFTSSKEIPILWPHSIPSCLQTYIWSIPCSFGLSSKLHSSRKHNSGKSPRFSSIFKDYITSSKGITIFWLQSTASCL